MVLTSRRLPRNPKGVVAFEVNDFAEAFMFDLKSSGIRFPRSDVVNDYLMRIKGYEILDTAELMISDRVESLAHMTQVCYFKSRIILCRIYLDPTNHEFIRYVLFVTLNRGLARVLSERLEKLGWKRVLLFDIARKREYSITKY